MLGYRFVVLTYVIGIALVCVISTVAAREQLEMETREKRRSETISKCKEGVCLPSLQQFNNNGKGELWKKKKISLSFLISLFYFPKYNLHSGYTYLKTNKKYHVIKNIMYRYI